MVQHSRSRTPRGTSRARWLAWAGLGVLACGDAPPEPIPALTTAVDIGGVTSYDWLGYAAAPAGDVDGDGHPDLLVAALDSSSGGRVRLFRGPLRSSTRLGEAAAEFVGEAQFSNLGEGLRHSGGCDVNGDGRDDIVLGAPFMDGVEISLAPNISGDQRGRAYVFFGQPSMSGRFVADEADLILIGDADFDLAGSTTTCLGDLDGDGFDELAITARRAGDARQGAVYLLYGGPDPDGERPIGDADARIVGIGAHDGTGTAVAAAGDLDGDGRVDLAIGAPYHDPEAEDAGAVFVLYGTDSRWSGDLSLDAAPRLVTATPLVRVGSAVAAAGDLDADGIDDLVVGASPLHHAEQPGGAYVVLGRRERLTAGASAIEDHAVFFRAESLADQAGAAVAGLGDVNGDGFDEIVVSAPRGGAHGGGRLYVVAGHPTYARGQVQSLESAARRLDAARADDQLGAVLGADDLDGDGVAELVAVSYGSDATQPDAGRVQVFRFER